MHYSYTAFCTFFGVIKQREFLYYFEATEMLCYAYISELIIYMIIVNQK
jgi:hypothetical protein